GERLGMARTAASRAGGGGDADRGSDAAAGMAARPERDLVVGVAFGVHEVFPQAAVAGPAADAAAREMHLGDEELAVAVGADVFGVGRAAQHDVAVVAGGARHA